MINISCATYLIHVNLNSSSVFNELAWSIEYCMLWRIREGHVNYHLSSPIDNVLISFQLSSDEIIDGQSIWVQRVEQQSNAGMLLKWVKSIEFPADNTCMLRIIVIFNYRFCDSSSSVSNAVSKGVWFLESSEFWITWIFVVEFHFLYHQQQFYCHLHSYQFSCDIFMQLVTSTALSVMKDRWLSFRTLHEFCVPIVLCHCSSVSSEVEIVASRVGCLNAM